MHIVIDAHMLGEQEGGNETYMAGLLEGLELTLSPISQTKITALYNPRYKPPENRIRVRSAVLHNRGSIYRLLWEIPSICRYLKADLLHVTYNAPLFSACPFVVTVHDVIFRIYPEYFTPRVRMLLTTLVPFSMWRATFILTDSEASKQDIVRYYPFVQNKIVVTPGAAGPVATTQPDYLKAEKYTQDRKFILSVGSVQPRKNILRLIQAYILLRQREATNARLIIVGRSGWQGSQIQKLALNSPYADDIIFTGYLDDAVLAALYRKCAVFVYPSLYEGFGLPVLEAMACGAPVITSNLSSLPEIAGDAALFVDPYSVAQISAAINQVLSNDALREELIFRGLRRASRYSWERTVQETLAVYERAVQAQKKWRKLW